MLVYQRVPTCTNYPSHLRRKRAVAKALQFTELLVLSAVLNASIGTELIGFLAKLLAKKLSSHFLPERLVDINKSR